MVNSKYLIYSCVHLASDINGFQNMFNSVVKKYNVEVILSPIIDFKELYSHPLIDTILTLPKPYFQEGQKSISIPLATKKHKFFSIEEQLILHHFIFQDTIQSLSKDELGVLFKLIRATEDKITPNVLQQLYFQVFHEHTVKN